jgi:acetyl-CoA carboxylase/biotin carboxylase 1
VAVHFADLHDTPGRMKAKGVIRKQVQWSESRVFFYWRLVRRLKEFEIANNIISNFTFATTVAKVGKRKTIFNELQQWFIENYGSLQEWEDDRFMVTWYNSNVDILNAYVSKTVQSNISIQLVESLNKLSELTSHDIDNSNDSEVLKITLDKLLSKKSKELHKSKIRKIKKIKTPKN